MRFIFNILLISILFHVPATAQLQEEEQCILFSVPKDTPAHLLESGESFIKNHCFHKKEYPVRRFFRVIGNVKMPEPFSDRGEGNFRNSEFLLNDHLDSINTYQDTYALFFQGKNDPFEREVYNRVSVPDIQSGKLTIEIPVKKDKLKIDPKGFFGLELHVYYKKEGRHPHDIYDIPDTILYFPISGGSSKYKVLKKDFILPQKTVTILMKGGGTFFSGKCWLEAPRLYQNRKEVFKMPFTSFEKRENNYNYWVGINLSSRSWPMWKLEFKGKTIFEGNIFDRASNIADFYIPLPDDLSGEGELKLTLLKEPYKAFFPYELRGVQILEESTRDFEIVSIPKYISAGDTAGILIEVNKPATTSR